MALILFHATPIQAQETPAGPELLAPDTPYLRINERFMHFGMNIVDRTPEDLQADWGTPATRALALFANDMRPRSFEEMPGTPSHVVGEEWYSTELPVGSTLLLEWDAQGYDGPAMWFAAQWDGMRLAIFSSRVDPRAPERWYPLEPGKSSYDTWTAGDQRVEMEVFLPESMSKTVLYRFRPLDQEGDVASATPAAPEGAETPQETNATEPESTGSNATLPETADAEGEATL